MFKRYPHIVILRRYSETDSTDGINTEQLNELTVEGRFEPIGQSENLNYKAKFYCSIQDTVDDYDGHKLVFKGREYTVSQLFRYQTHWELWLD